VADVLGIAPVIRALDAVESGDLSEEHFATIGDDWDIEERTRAQLESALLAYQGAFVVVSHDERFLAEIGVGRWLRLSAGRLVETGPLGGD
jgi:hypothetical protein